MRIVVQLIVGLSLCLALSGCGKPKVTSKSSVHNERDKLMVMIQVQELTRDALVKAENDEELDAGDKEKLRKALPLITDMVNYDPTSFPPQVILGKADLALGLSGEAEKAYLQACKVEPANVDDQTRLLVASVYNDLARISFNRKDYQQAEARANQALIIAPDDPKFVANLASIQIQAGHLTQAKATISLGLLKTPKDSGLKSLQRFLEEAQKSTPPSKAKP